MKNGLIVITFILMLSCSSCQICRSLGFPCKNPPCTTYTYEEESETKAVNTEVFNTIFDPLPESVKNHFDDNFNTELQQYAIRYSPKQTEINLRLQLSLRPQRLPHIPDFTMPLRFESRYDGYVTHYQLRSPKTLHEGQAFVLILGALKTSLADMNYTRDDWVLHIPSRPNMNYQLVAEGDLWSIVNDIQELYPQLKTLPHYLVGLGDAADAALYFANRYRCHFHGVAFSGGKLGKGLPNLDSLPVVYFPSESEPHSSVWGQHHLITSLNIRGNNNAKVITGTLSQAITTLASCAPTSTLTPFIFEDYSDAQIWPWLRVTAKKSEKEPVIATSTINGDELVLNIPNASSVNINRSEAMGFPAAVNKIRFNENLFAFQHRTESIILGEEEIHHSSNKKSNTPPEFRNFFCHEPLYIVYQDQGASALYLQQAAVFADALSKLKLLGFPSVNIQLPLLPLSEYHSEQLPDHRIIAIGQPYTLSKLLSTNESYYPVTVGPEGVRLRYHSLSLPFSRFDGVAYKLTYPPEKEGPLKLAMLLAAHNEKGLQVLSQHYLSATALYRSSDLRLWIQQDQSYLLAGEYHFDSYWGCSDCPSAELEIPPISKSVWEEYFRELLIAESRLPTMIISPIVDEQLSPPTNLTIASLCDYAPERHFAVVHFTRETPPNVVRRLINNIDNAVFMGFNDLNPATVAGLAKIVKHKQSVLVDAQVIEALSATERGCLDYFLFPYSLHEMIIKKFIADKTLIGKELIKLNNYLADY